MNTGRALLGIVLTAVGVVLLLDQAGVADAGAVLSTWWPLVLVAAGGLALLGRPRAVGAGVVVTAAGVALLGVTTGLLAAVGWELVWAVALIAGGIWLVLGRPGRPSSTDDVVDATVVFSGREIRSTARPFRGGSVIAILGGVELDLTAAELGDGAVLDAVAILGGAEITVPSGWRVRMNGPAILGGLDNEAEGLLLPDTAPVLDVRALALLGGVDVKVRAPAPAAVSAPASHGRVPSSAFPAPRHPLT